MKPMTTTQYSRAKRPARERAFSSLLLIVALSAFGNVSVATAADGKSLFEQRLCITCHGVGGAAPIISTYPRLAGQNKDYLVQQFKDIQSGARNNAQTSAMKGIVAGVSAEDIDAIAEYLSKL